MKLTTQTASQLLAQYAALIEELRRRGITRSSNNPVGDYTELLCEKALSLRTADKSTKGYDATDSRGARYQIKGRRLTRHSDSRQLGVLRDLNSEPFDYLVGVLFTEEFRVFRACHLPISQLPDNSKYVERTNSWRFLLRDSVWSLPGAVDLTARLTKAQVTHGL